MFVSTGSLMGLLSTTYVLLKIAAFWFLTRDNMNGACSDMVVVQIADRVLGFSRWALVISNILAILIMFYYLGRTMVHRWDFKHPSKVEYEENIYWNEVLAPMLVIIAGAAVLIFDVSACASFIVPRLVKELQHLRVPGSEHEHAGTLCVKVARIRDARTMLVVSTLLYILILVVGHYSGIVKRKGQKDSELRLSPTIDFSKK